jgi:chitinase
LITKAGVPTYKILGGSALYGRSFQMSTPGCYGPNCTFTGPNSGAIPGKCTQAVGTLSLSEIYTIWGNASANPQHYDDGQYGDILVYNNNQWVSFITPSNYEARRGAYQWANFGGLADWVSAWVF